jgi:hypothetical protein
MAKLMLDRVRQRGQVTVQCPKPGAVLISSDFVTIARRGDGSVGAEKLREVVFSGGKRVSSVLVRPPVSRTRAGAVSKKTRVVSWAQGADKLRPFRFDTRLPLPQSLLIQGTLASSSPNDTSYDFEFYDAKGKMVAAGTLRGTVVAVDTSLDVEKRMGAAFSTTRRVLALASGQAEATITPDLSPGLLWAYPPDAATLGTPDQPTTSFTAGRGFTPAGQMSPELTLTLTFMGGQLIEVFGGVRITAPQKLRLGADERGSFQTIAGALINMNVSLFTETITYVLLDQDEKRITDSAYGGASPTIRENIHQVLMSSIPALQTYIDQTLRAQRTWRLVPEGRFTDRLEAQNLPVSLIRRRQQGRLVFVDDLLQIADGRSTGVLMETRPDNHIWFLSVNGDETLAVGATDNPFRVSVSRIVNPRSLELTSTYQVVLPR